MESLTAHFKPIIENALLAKVVNVLLLVALAWLSGSLIAQWFHQGQAPRLPVLEAAQSGAVSAAKGQALLLFGEPEAKSLPTKNAVETIDVDNVKKSRLNLTLMGVIKLSNQGIALIKKGNDTLVLSQGEEIQRGVTLQEVLPEQVILLNQGVQEKLLLKREANALLETTSSSAPSAIEPSAEAATKLSDIGSQLKKSPMSISQYLRFQPINQGGKWTGVKIWPKEDKALFDALGFQEGDFVTQVNGRPIDEMARNPSLWQALLAESRVDLTIERDGIEQTISVDFN